MCLLRAWFKGCHSDARPTAMVVPPLSVNSSKLPLPAVLNTQRPFPTVILRLSCADTMGSCTLSYTEAVASRAPRTEHYAQHTKPPTHLGFDAGDERAASARWPTQLPGLRDIRAARSMLRGESPPAHDQCHS